MNSRKLATMVAAGLSLVISGVGCTAYHRATATDATNAAATKLSSYDVNKYALNKTVCNPLNDGVPPTTTNDGVHASLYYLGSTQPRYNTVSDMITNGFKSKQDLFFTEINVPTRMFTEGFPLQTGGKVQDDQNADLLEWFAIHFDGVIHLGPNDPESDYQFALLADDGAVLSLANGDAGYQTVVDDDGVHPTRLGCGSVITMTKSTHLDMKLDYYQGPRYHIALIPLWREVNSSTMQPEPLCGQLGNSLYFDPNNNSQPLTAYMDLLSRGWRPLVAANYSVSSSTGFNPCVTGTPPVISGLAVTNNLETNTVTVTWSTDIPATDQVLLINTSTSEQNLTTSDNVLRTQHSIALVGVVLGGIDYTIQAISISSDFGKTISSPVAERFH